jgi:putative peptidoglycan lipid II flippase
MAIIGSVLFIAPGLSKPVMGLALGVLLGGALQLALQLSALLRTGFRFRQVTRWMHPGLKKVARLIPPVIFGGAVYQINILVSTLLASLLPQGSVTYLYFADRLVQFPLGVFAIAAATAVLPSLSRQAAARRIDELRNTFALALRLVFFITIPAMVGLIVLREPIVALLFQRGEFDAAATRLTSLALLYYSVGLWAFSAVKIVSATFFALQDTRTPVRMAAVSIAANIILGVALMKPLAHGGLALATSLASMLNLVLLVGALRIKLGPLDGRSIAKSACRTLLNSVIMGLAVGATAKAMLPAGNAQLPARLAAVTVSIAVGLCVFGIISYVTRSQELAYVLAEIRKGLGRQ